MDSKSFVDNLRELAPTKDVFQRYSVSDEYVANYRQRYICFERIDTRPITGMNNEILILIRTYDCSTLGIGNLTFLSNEIEYDNFYRIGNVELDFLVLNKITLEVEVRDHDSPNHIIWPCASNSNNFLAALIACVVHLNTILKDPSLDGDDGYVLQNVSMCVQKAGGEKYLDFYKMLLGHSEY